MMRQAPARSVGPWRACALLCHCLAVLLFAPDVLAGTAPDSSSLGHDDAIKVFLDCRACDQDFLRSELTFVNYVRDRSEAQVHLLVTQEPSGNGGLEYTLTFIGEREFSGTNDTLHARSKRSDTDDAVRQELLRAMKLGLIRYAARTPLANHIGITYSAGEKPAQVADRWDYWVFSLSCQTYVNGQQAHQSTSIYGSVSANRITKDLKVLLSANVSYNEDNYEKEIYNNVNRGKGFDAMIAPSIDDHWSVGWAIGEWSTTYSNIAFSVTTGPAVEYNLFPYSESTRRQLRLQYRFEASYVDFEHETIYNKLSDRLLNHKLTASLDVKETWGSAGIFLLGSDYTHDRNKYRLEAGGNITVRLFEGFSIGIDGNVSKSHDQLTLPKGEATDADILRQVRELESEYNFFGSLRFSYTFGSIFNNIVNPRFGRGF